MTHVQPPSQRPDIRPHDDHHVSRRALVAGAGASLALAGLAGYRQHGFGLAQGQSTPATPAANRLNPGPATPNVIGPAIPPELTQYAMDWPAPGGNLANQRANMSAAINASNVAQLELAWSFPVKASGAFGGMTCGVLIAGDMVYVQDMQSNVFALNRDSGQVVWEHDEDTATDGPNGVALGYGMIYGLTGATAEAFALDASTGAEVWRVNLSDNPGVGTDMTPTVYDNVVYVSTVPGNAEAFYEGGQKGVIYALDAQSGAPLWDWDTTDNLWGNPQVNSGGGLWYAPAVDDAGNLYIGTGNAGPWPGIVANGTPYPNGSSRPGPNDYASSMVSLAPNGSVRWHVNAKPHDLFDHDFQLTPILATVAINGQDTKIAIGSGKAGKVIAANADTGEVLWDVKVAKHQNDELQEIPPGETVEVYPGSLGAVESPMAFANGLVFVPTFDNPSKFTATTQEGSAPFNEATGALYALDAANGTVRWLAQLPNMNVGGVTVANDVVFTMAMDGVLRALEVASGKELWRYQASSGCNASPAVAGDVLIVPATGPRFTTDPAAQDQIGPAVFAFRLGGGAATPAATPIG